MQNFGRFAAVIVERVRDAAAKLSTEATQTALDAALAEYARDCPREVTLEISGSGGFDYATSAWGAAESGTTAATRWVAGFSQLRQVVYPYVSTSRDLPVLDLNDLALVRLPAGEVLRFLSATPLASEKFLVTFTRPHEVTVGLSTVPPNDAQAVCSLAAAYALQTLSAYYAQATNSSLDADVADHRGRTSLYLDLARTYRAQYEQHVGRGDTAGQAPRAAGGFVDADGGFANASGTDYFFHGRRRR